jgi:peptide/nickel transport system substrate-binding protein
MTVLNDPNARQTALLTGDVDAITLVELKTLALLERRPQHQGRQRALGGAITMPMFCDTAPFDDVRVRRR